MVLLVALLALGLAGGGYWWAPFIILGSLEAVALFWRATS